MAFVGLWAVSGWFCAWREERREAPPPTWPCGHGAALVGRPRPVVPSSRRRVCVRLCVCLRSPPLVLHLSVPRCLDRCSPFLGTGGVSLLILSFSRVILAFSFLSVFIRAAHCLRIAAVFAGSTSAAARPQTARGARRAPRLAQASLRPRCSPPSFLGFGFLGLHTFCPVYS